MLAWLRYLLRLEKRYIYRLEQLRQKITKTVDGHNGRLPKSYEMNFIWRDVNYQKWLSRLKVVAEHYGFHRDSLESLDDGTFPIFFFRGFTPEETIRILYGSTPQIA